MTPPVQRQPHSGPGPGPGPGPRTVTLIRGDGIGPEIAQAVVEVFAAAEVPVVWDEASAGLSSVEQAGTVMPEATLESVRRHRVALKGPTTTPIGGGHKSVNVTIRKALDLFANVRPCRTLPGVVTRFEEVDLIIVRENIEDTYAGIEHMQTPDVAQCLRLITRPGSLAIADYAFQMARREGRKRITCAQKANIHKITDGLFLECFRETAGRYPDIQAEEMLVDNCCMQLVTNPRKFDVILTTNLLGDILSDLCAGLVGGLGVAPGGNIGAGRAVFEAVHGSAPDIAGKGLANPTALLLSAVQMLRWMGLLAHADRVEGALRAALVNHIRTRDLGGTASTKEFTAGVIAHLPPPSHLDRAAAAESQGAAPPPEQGQGGPVVVRTEAWTLRGIDFFCDHSGLPPLPTQAGPFRLTLISNRGTKVFPGPTPPIDLVNCHRCRYISDGGVTDEQVLALIADLTAKGFRWMHIEKLHDGPDGVARYTKAQGE